MGLVEKMFRKQRAVSHKDKLELRGEPRNVNGKAVECLDEALARAAGAPVDQILHGIDPRRILSFENGGPPVWSVALCPSSSSPSGFLFVTYGLSKMIDPSTPFEHEMSIRVASNDKEPPSWPMFLLRHLARYQITGGRDLGVGDPMTFAEPITRAAMAPEHQHNQPDSSLRAIGVMTDPILGAVGTPHASSKCGEFTACRMKN